MGDSRGAYALCVLTIFVNLVVSFVVVIVALFVIAPYGSHVVYEVRAVKQSVDQAGRDVQFVRDDIVVIKATQKRLNDLMDKAEAQRRTKEAKP